MYRDLPDAKEYLIVEPSKYGYVKLPDLFDAPEKEKEAGAKGSWMDKFQTVLDWLGLIPGIGDAIDVVNAIIYFARGKYIDGILTSLAVIPVIGSIVALGLKMSIKTMGKGSMKLLSSIGRMRKGGKTAKAVEKEWREAFLRSKQIDGEMLGTMAKWALKTAQGVRKAAKYVNKLPFGGAAKREIRDLLHELSTALANIGKISRETKLIKKATKAAEAAAKAPVDVKDMAWLMKKVNKLTSGAGKYFTKATDGRLMKMFGFEFGPYAKNLRKAIDQNFVKKIARNPDEFVKMVKFNGSSNRLRKEILTLLEREKADIVSGLKNKGLKGKASKDLTRLIDQLKAGRSSKATMNASEEALTRLLNNKKVKGEAQQLMQKYGQEAVDNGSDIVTKYREIVSADPKLFKDMFRTGLGADAVRNINRGRKKVLKNYGLWWNEIEDVLEKAGVTERGEVDNPNGVVLLNVYYFLTQNVEVPVISDLARIIGSGSKTAIKMFSNLHDQFWGDKGMIASIQDVMGLEKQKVMFNTMWSETYPNMTSDEKVAQLLRMNGDNYKQVITNLKSGNKMGISASVTDFPNDSNLDAILANYEEGELHKTSEPKDDSLAGKIAF